MGGLFVWRKSRAEKAEGAEKDACKEDCCWTVNRNVTIRLPDLFTADAATKKERTRLEGRGMFGRGIKIGRNQYFPFP
jgi:hypothetical protein